MFAFLDRICKPAALLAAGLIGLAACAPGTIPGAAPSGGPAVDRAQPVTVALLVPKSDQGGGAGVAQSLENAARLAVADVQGAQIDLRVYDTAGQPGAAADAASRALNDGAQIILGPLYTQTTSAVTGVVAGRNVNVLSFSNNTAVAGGNIYVLGQTFADTADRLTGYARRAGLGSTAIVHGEGLAGEAGRQAIAAAATRNGLNIATVQAYQLSQQGIIDAGPRIAEAITQSGAETVFLTASADSDLPLIATALPDNGAGPNAAQFLGLTRWNAASQAMDLPGLQGGWFTLPDGAAQTGFEARYAARYGSQPHPIAGLAYDGVQAVASLVASGAGSLSGQALTQADGFAGAYGIFRLRPDGTNQRALAVAQVRGGQAVVIDPAPKRFGRAGF